MLTAERVKTLISKCLGVEIDSLSEMTVIRDRAGREIIDCQYQTFGKIERGMLKVYHKGFDDDSELGVAKVAMKTQLSSRDLSVQAIGIPEVFGAYLSDNISCVLMEKLKETHWESNTRVVAAEILARLHNTPLVSLSDELQQLIRDSKPNRDRGRFGVIGRSKFLDAKIPRWRDQFPELSGHATLITENIEPVSSMTTLVHGDYFSVNLIPTRDGLYVIDWDLLALGDPMWDLGFLVGADHGVSDIEVEDVVRAYQRTRPIDEDILRWQQVCWKTLRELIKLMNEYRNI